MSSSRRPFGARRAVTLLLAAVVLLGLGSAATRPSVAAADGGRTYTTVSAGIFHTCALATDGAISCWGSNDSGMSRPPAGTYESVALGGRFTCALATDGAINCWGSNDIEQLNSPAGTYQSIATGDRHACAIATDDSIDCWGYNAFGQTQAPAGAFKALTLGWEHTCGLRTDGTIACWGYPDRGLVNPPNGVYKALVAGEVHNCAIAMDDTIDCWGWNDKGQRRAPAGTYKTFAAGHYHTCAIATDDTIACWGNNGRGQVDTPAGTFAALAVRSHNGCAIRTEGTVACWPGPPGGVRWVSGADDDNPQVTVSFGSAMYTATEGDTVAVTVSLSADPERSVTIPLTTANQNGASSADYSIERTSITFESGDTSKAFFFSAIEDTDDDGGESVAIGFGTLPTGVTAGGTNDTVVTITMGVTTTRPPIFLGGGGGGGPSGPTPSTVDFEWTVKHDIDELDAGHGSPTGLWSDGTTLWLAENGDGADDAIYAYDLESGERVEDREFELDERNRAPRGVWSDRSTIWVSDSGQNQLFAHDLASGERLPDSDIELAERNRDGRGIWSDEVTMWVLDGVKDSLFAYDLATGELLGEYALASANNDPHGIWSDGVTVWVSNHDPKHLFAYRLPVPDAGEPAEGEDEADEVKALERVRDEEFDKLSRASNNSPRGIWSDGDVMYVADASDGKVYTYNMPDAIDARLATLSLSGVDFGEFDGGQTEYVATPGEGVTETTVEATTVQRRTDVAFDPPDADGDDANGHQVSLQGVSAITVTVTSADGSRTRVYRVTVRRAEVEVALAPTWTSIEWPGADGVTVAGALQDGDIADKVVVVYHWDEATAAWRAFFPGLEGVPGLNTLTTFTAGGIYWIAVGEPLTWTVATP